jgi:hypothetical protein
MRVIRQIEAASLDPTEISRLAEEAGNLAAQEYRKTGFH